MCLVLLINLVTTEPNSRRYKCIFVNSHRQHSITNVIQHYHLLGIMGDVQTKAHKRMCVGYIIILCKFL